MITLKGKAWRTELRAAIRAFGTKLEKMIWDGVNQDIRRFTLEGKGRRWRPKRITKYILKKRKGTEGRATRVAKPYGGTAKDVLLEMAKYWRHYDSILPDCQWLRFAWLHYGRKADYKDEVDLCPAKITVVAMRIKHGYSFEIIGALTKTSTGSAHRYWHEFLDAVKDGQCKCKSPHCSMNTPAGRTLIADSLDVQTQRAKNSAFKSLAAMVPGGGVRGHRGVGYGQPRQVAEVNGVLKIHNHRLVWNQYKGLIPSEHEVHHLDGDTHNDAIGNLVLLPRWAHSACHLAASVPLPRQR